MKKILFALLLCLIQLTVWAQGTEPYRFQEFKTLLCSPVKNQGKTGTCWCFAGISMLESELIRQGKGQHDLSEMYLARQVYRQKCENYVRRQGYTRLSEGGLIHDLLAAVKQFGVVPEEIYSGKKSPDEIFDHSKLEKRLLTECDTLVAWGKVGKLPPDWLTRIDAILNDHFGTTPQKFTYAGQVFTPQRLAEHLGIRAEDYVSITSFTHHPFWTSFVLEVPDNYAHGSFYNVPLDDLMRCLNYSIQQGYTVGWDADVSNAGFAPKENIAIVPQVEWKDKTEVQRQRTFKFSEPEKFISQEYRQQLFDSQTTTDDHLMHIVGIADEPNNGVFYKVKNSWGEIFDWKGFFFASEAYVRLNTISFTFNKNALPTDILRRLGLEPGEVNIEMRSPPTPATTPTPTPPEQTKAGRAKLRAAENQNIIPATAPNPKNTSKSKKD